MPFESLLLRTREGGPASRCTSLALAFLLHAALIMVAIVHSVWHVDEVLPPTVIIRIGPVMPPAPADAPAGSQAKTKQQDRTRPARKKEVASTDVVAPAPEPPEKAPAELVPDSPVQTDTSPATGITGGKTGPVGTDADGKGGNGHDDRPCTGDECKAGPSPLPPADHILPPAIGAKTCSYCPPPSLPLHLRNAGQQRSLMVKICVSSDGSVSKVTILQGIEPAADIAIVGAIHHWRYDPPTVSGHPVPFCYVTRFTFVAQ